MSEPTITPKDEARYMQVMADYDELMLAGSKQPVPMCHFMPMTFHGDDSYSGGDGYQCEHCGHSDSAEEAWAKVEACKKKSSTSV